METSEKVMNHEFWHRIKLRKIEIRIHNIQIVFAARGCEKTFNSSIFRVYFNRFDVFVFDTFFSSHENPLKRITLTCLSFGFEMHQNYRVD